MSQELLVLAVAPDRLRAQSLGLPLEEAIAEVTLLEQSEEQLLAASLDQR